MTRVLVGACLALCLSLPAPAADDPESRDARFKRAHNLAFVEADREGARQLCRELLDEHPDDVEVRTFLGRLHAWDQQYVEARREFEAALAARPTAVDTRRAAIDVELWSDRPAAALALADEGLMLEPGEAGLLDRRARALSALERDQEAAEAAWLAFEADPENRERVKLYRRMLEATQRHKVQAAYEYEAFDDDTDSWQATSVSYRRQELWGSPIGRVNQAWRFDEDGTQLEIDGYIDVRAGTYVFANAGFSSGELFPDTRYGAEIFDGFADGWEASLGARWLDFDDGDPVVLWTGSIARYLGDYWVGLRPTYSSDTDGRSLSGRLFVRRIANGRHEYTELSFGRGAGTDKGLVVDPGDLDTSSVRLEHRHRIGHSLILLGAAGLRSEELTDTRDRESGFVQIGIERLF